jgi:hypothetical protein
MPGSEATRVSVTSDNKCCGSAYIDHIKIAQFLCEDAWAKTPVSPTLMPPEEQQ